MDFDLFIIGGGINGAGIARDAAGRGLRVGLCERDDLGAHTSSASTKLIHGGLRYLENYEFRLVREALKERERLLAIAPHIIWPLRFVLPHHKGLRPAWLLRLGLFIYDRLGGRISLPRTERVDLHTPPFGGDLKSAFAAGFAYSDCWVDDARLVVLNAVDARDHGADIRTRTECVAIDRHADHWRLTLQTKDGSQERVTARAIVNAAGPWVDEIANKASVASNRERVRLVKGSHIVTRKLYEGAHAYIFQHADGRIIFAIPYEDDFTLIGTTDVAVSSPQDAKSVSPEEESYLCALVSEYFATPVTSDDVIWRYAGVRPLFDDAEESASKVTRDYTLKLNTEGAPVLSIYGGKITTYRKLAEHALEKLEPHLSATSGAWTGDALLPGGGFHDHSVESVIEEAKAQYPFLPAPMVRRLIRTYGTQTQNVLGDAAMINDLGRGFGADLYEAELVYLKRREFVETAEDALWRRTKLGLRLTEVQQTAVTRWFEENSETGQPALAARRSLVAS